MKKLFATVAACLVAVGVLFGASACGQVGDESAQVSEKETPLIGYVTIGPITAQRTAEEKDVQSAFKSADMDMVYMPSAKHKEQVASFDKFVRDKVDAILLTPAQTEGWVSELEKAKKADIPVFLLDGDIDSDDSSLYTSKIGPSNTWAGEQAAQFINTTFPEGAKGLLLEGPTTSSVTQQRTSAWEKTIADNIAVVDSAEGDWSVETAVKQTTELLEKFKGDGIKFIFAQNDEMGLGAADAVKALAQAQEKAASSATGSSASGSSSSDDSATDQDQSGDASETTGDNSNPSRSANADSSSPTGEAADSNESAEASGATGSADSSSTDQASADDYSAIKIVTIDGTKPALRALIAGKFASVIESNPLIGEKTASMVRKVLDGKKVEKTVTIKSKIFTPESAKEALSSRKY